MSGLSELPGLAGEQELINVMFAYAINRTETFKKGKLAHYTSAENAMNIIKNEGMWLRNATVMNDFSEIAHGKECLYAALEGDRGEKFWRLLDDAHPLISTLVKRWLATVDEVIRRKTYMTSLSEHEADDNKGRLSMWRAYGGSVSGVALILNADFTQDENPHIPVIASPVLYADKGGFASQFDAMLDRLDVNKQVLKVADAGIVFSTVTRSLMFAMISCKHMGFEEEREWRLIHLPEMGREHPFVARAIESVRGIPQIVHKLPLKNVPRIGDTSLSRLLSKVIIGPTLYPLEVRDAFINLLEQAKVPDAINKVIVSDIPLRQWG